MKVINNFICIILGIFSSLLILIIKSFMLIKNYSFFSIVITIFKILLVTLIVISGYVYFIYNNINMYIFYPIIKIIELLIPVIVSIFYYKAKPKLINYIGIILAIISIIFIEL